MKYGEIKAGMCLEGERAGSRSWQGAGVGRVKRPNRDKHSELGQWWGGGVPAARGRCWGGGGSAERSSGEHSWGWEGWVS